MKNSSIIVLAPAKINLALAVKEKRADGYHSLQTVFQSVSLFDRIKLELKREGIACSCGELSGELNLAYKAAQVFLNELQTSEEPAFRAGVEITIEKNIPLQAGLAGGSSDAAAVIRGLNRLFLDPFSYEQLLTLAKKCGSDTSFCLKGGTQWGEGNGSDLEELPEVSGMDLILVKPKQGVSTAEAFQLFDEQGDYSTLDKDSWINVLGTNEAAKIGKKLSNSLEKIVFELRPEISHIKKLLLDEGCYGAVMSGSGSAVFGILQEKKQGEELEKILTQNGDYHVWFVKTTSAYAI